MDVTLLVGAILVVGGIFLAGWLIWGSRGEPKVALSSGGHDTTDLRAAILSRSASERAQPFINRLGHRLRSVAPSSWVPSIERKVQRAGSPAGWTVDRVLGAKLVFSLTALLLGVLQLILRPSGLTFLLAIGLTVAGFLLPDLILTNKAEKRQLAIRSSLADTIDQLAITVRAGLSVDAAIARVARTTRGPLSDELTRVVQDVRVGAPRGTAMLAMAERVDVPELRQFAAALAQAEKLGVPVSQTLQVQAVEMRTRRRQFAEERAMKLPVKILFPMVFCIFPCLFIVLLGPAAIRIIETLGDV
jgi:tight adherence protein C